MKASWILHLKKMKTRSKKLMSKNMSWKRWRNLRRGSMGFRVDSNCWTRSVKVRHYADYWDSNDAYCISMPTLLAFILIRILTSCVGAFSSVYKAIDLEYDLYDNSNWDYEIDEPLRVKDTGDTKNTAETTTQSSRPEGGKVIAIKRIYVTSSPARIENEIAILHDLR